jgi:uncharacterized protein with ParB-like and HNH nuclease domain
MIVLSVNHNEEVYLNIVKISEEGEEPILYELKDDKSKTWVKLHLKENRFSIEEQDIVITEPLDDLRAKLDDLVLEVIEQAQSGTDGNELSGLEISPYDPDAIKVQTKPFNIRLISEMIDNEDIDLTPDFQRHFVWNPIQKSRLIESILLRIPLPMFYFSEDDEGKITVVDGLQRLTTIKEFMENKFPLKDLEYLKDSCEGRYYSDKNKDGKPNGKAGIDVKYFRWFNMTQFTVNVIDPSSPAKVKYDIFKRINTGGKPLNHQEIRNSLATKTLRDTLRTMANSEIFKWTTDNSIRSTRMEDQEVALRFLCFHRYYREDKTLDNYNGNMETTLNDATELFGKYKKEALDRYVSLFINSMESAGHLFGTYAFRKVLVKHLNQGASKQLINKALFVSCSVILSFYEPKVIKAKNEYQCLIKPLAQKIEEDRMLYNYLSFGTNSKANIQYAFTTIENLIEQHLNY